jgi:hypothetical protein
MVGIEIENVPSSANEEKVCVIVYLKSTCHS